MRVQGLFLPARRKIPSAKTQYAPQTAATPHSAVWMRRLSSIPRLLRTHVTLLLTTGGNALRMNAPSNASMIPNVILTTMTTASEILMTSALTRRAGKLLIRTVAHALRNHAMTAMNAPTTAATGLPAIAGR
ncbi:hypothetical protein D6764_01750 [Candidatus Woesearchaeota archaeon]|nr:MAG: hypothetical protein D6764_01750 [Candidatus Woesearchaeota archaeon]